VWLKVKALSSSPSTEKKRKKEKETDLLKTGNEKLVSSWVYK
jgi:hypothetical protein